MRRASSPVRSAAGLALAVAVAPLCLAFTRGSPPRLAVGLWAFSGAMLAVAALWMTLEAHQAIPRLNMGSGLASLWPRVQVPSLCVVVAGALVAMGLWRAGHRLVRASLAAALLVSVAPGARVLTTVIGGVKPLEGNRLIDAYLRPPDQEQMATYLRWFHDGEDERIFQAGNEDWRVRSCMGGARGMPAAQAASSRSPAGGAERLQRRVGSVHLDPDRPLRDPPAEALSPSLLMDWVVVTDLQGSFQFLEVRPSPAPLPRDGPGWAGILVGIAAVFLLLWGALYLLLRSPPPS